MHRHSREVLRLAALGRHLDLLRERAPAAVQDGHLDAVHVAVDVRRRPLVGAHGDVREARDGGRRRGARRAADAVTVAGVDEVHRPRVDAHLVGRQVAKRARQLEAAPVDVRRAHADEDDPAPLRRQDHRHRVAAVERRHRLVRLEDLHVEVRRARLVAQEAHRARLRGTAVAGSRRPRESTPRSAASRTNADARRRPRAQKQFTLSCFG